MNTLLIFDATNFTRHVTAHDNPSLVDYIIRNYGYALQYGLLHGQVNGTDIENVIRQHYDDAYLNAFLGDAYNHYDSDAFELRQSMGSTVTEEGFNNAKGRYDELVGLCIQEFNSQVIAVLRGLLSQNQKIFTVDVLGYENKCLRILLSTNGALHDNV